MIVDNITLVLPLQLILFQVLFLLVTIALESRVFHRRLNLTRKNSVQYATSLNLWSVVIGWLTFLILGTSLPQVLQIQIVSFIFFDHPIGSQLDKADPRIIFIGIVIFFFSFLIKIIGFELIKIWIHEQPEQFDTSSDVSNKRPRLFNQPKRKITRNKPNPALAVLLANAYSYSAILLLLVLRFMDVNVLNLNIAF
ncbi:filament integrity protein FraC [Coleofasciculus chthonoplastes]|uniref:filament integrity protein FraC n=1 Tax=Coleofasciculus chthonoplastes TaxID=64178 RepID=UPI0032F86174